MSLSIAPSALVVYCLTDIVVSTSQFLRAEKLEFEKIDVASVVKVNEHRGVVDFDFYAPLNPLGASFRLPATHPIVAVQAFRYCAFNRGLRPWEGIVIVRRVWQHCFRTR